MDSTILPRFAWISACVYICMFFLSLLSLTSVPTVFFPSSFLMCTHTHTHSIPPSWHFCASNHYHHRYHHDHHSRIIIVIAHVDVYKCYRSTQLFLFSRGTSCVPFTLPLPSIYSCHCCYSYANRENIFFIFCWTRCSPFCCRSQRQWIHICI